MPSQPNVRRPRPHEEPDPVTKFRQILMLAPVVMALLIVAPPPLGASEKASVNDVARYLAGLAPSEGSVLARYAAEPTWRTHSRFLDQAWARIEKQQLSHIRAWSAKNVPAYRPFMLYMFSGPDFLYANAFFPKATTYVFSALEPVGPIPNPMKLSRGARSASLHNLRASLHTVLSYSFFITKDMGVKLRQGGLKGTLPVFLVFLARSGHTINDITHVILNTDGTVTPKGDKAPKGSSPGLKIAFADQEGTARTLYYFRTDLSNAGLKKSGFTKFIEGFGPADSLIKSASYLLHYGQFSEARKLLLSQGAVHIQDDSGIPLQYFPKDQWKLQPFGRYLGPIKLFAGRYQKDLNRLFAKSATDIKFGIGYRWRRNQSNVLLGIKKPAVASDQKPAAKPE